MHKPLSNPPNPWSSTDVEFLGPPPEVRPIVFEERARSILSENSSPDIPFRFSLNPYRGCAHACAYCYSRPSHQYLGFGAGTDFESRIVVKTNAAELLEARLRRRSWKREPISFSGNTDPYQPLEASYGLTRRCLEVCLERRNPVGIITRGSLIRRDIELLQRLDVAVGVQVFITTTFDDEDLARAIEPGAPSIAARIKTIRLLAEAGITVGAAIAPIIPGLNDSQIPQILERVADAGASRAFMILLRLADEVEPVFTERIRSALPLRADKILNGLAEMREGKVGDRRFGERMVGKGARWEATRQLFALNCRKHGLNAGELPRDLAPPARALAPLRVQVPSAGAAEARPRAGAQLSLFG